MSPIILSRRTLLHGTTAVGLVSLLPNRLFAEASSPFVATSDPLPPDALHTPAPITPPPAANTALTFDIFGNHWCLTQPTPTSNTTLHVLPAQAPDHWFPDQVSNLPAHPWLYLAADEFGYLWIASPTRCLRLDPHTPDLGWLDFTPDVLASAKPERITALGIAPSGAVLMALDSGFIAEVDRLAVTPGSKTTVIRTPAPTNISRITTDDTGRLWLDCAGKSCTLPPAPTAWQRTWQLVDRLPAGDHDLSGDILNGRFYMAGGQNAGWGYPARPHVFRELFVFDPAPAKWAIAALLDTPRFYNGTSVLGDTVWIIGGYTRDQIGNAVLLNTVEIFNPATHTFTPGPPLPIAIDNPVALNIAGRIYVAGFTRRDNNEAPCHLLSIGPNETTWRSEPDGPSYLLALAGTAHNGSFYLAVPGKGLAAFDTRKRSWSVIPYPHPTRSPQIATYNDEIWILGGRDIDRQDQVLIYTPATNSWRKGPDLPRPLAWGAATTVGGSLLVVGGAAGRGYNNRTFLLRKHPLT